MGARHSVLAFESLSFLCSGNAQVKLIQDAVRVRHSIYQHDVDVDCGCPGCLDPEVRQCQLVGESG